MQPIKYKAVTFVIGGDIANGHYYYNLTLPEAIQKILESKNNPMLFGRGY